MATSLLANFNHCLVQNLSCRPLAHGQNFKGNCLSTPALAAQNVGALANSIEEKTLADFELALDIGFPAGDVILREANGSKSGAFISFVGGPEVRDIGVQEDEVVVAEGVLPTKGTAFAHASPDATSQLQSSPQQYFLQPRLGLRVSPWMQKSVLRRPLLRDFP